MSELEKLTKQRDELEKAIEHEKRRLSSSPNQEQSQTENRYLIMGFWEFSIISTLMIVFFPWSLLYCVIVHGLKDTKYILIAMTHDLIKTLFAVLAILLPLVCAIVYFALTYKGVI